MVLSELAFRISRKVLLMSYTILLALKDLVDEEQTCKERFYNGTVVLIRNCVVLNFKNLLQSLDKSFT